MTASYHLTAPEARCSFQGLEGKIGSVLLFQLLAARKFGFVDLSLKSPHLHVQVGFCVPISASNKDTSEITAYSHDLVLT